MLRAPLFLPLCKATSPCLLRIVSNDLRASASDGYALPSWPHPTPLQVGPGNNWSLPTISMRRKLPITTKLLLRQLFLLRLRLRLLRFSNNNTLLTSLSQEQLNTTDDDYFPGLQPSSASDIICHSGILSDRSKGVMPTDLPLENYYPIQFARPSRPAT